MKLTDEILKNAERRPKVYKLYDGAGLSAEIPPTGNIRWRFKFRFQTKEKRLSLGIYPTISIVAAREHRDALKKTLARGEDPAVNRKKAKKNRLIANNATESIIQINENDMNMLLKERAQIQARLNGLEYYVAELRVAIRDLKEQLSPTLN